MMQVSLYQGRASQPVFTTIDDLILLSQELLTRLHQIGQYKHPLGVRRGVQQMEKISKVVRAGGITYFIDVKTTRENKPYLMITESRYKGNDKKHDRNSIVIFQENAQEFVRAITELSARMS